MNEEELREQRMAELRERMDKQKQEESHQLEMEQQISAILNKVLSPEAKTRLTNIRLVNREKYLQVAQTIIMLARQGKIDEKITDEQLKQLLTRFGEKRDITITRK